MWLNNGKSGGFTLGSELASNGGSSVAVGDLDGDGTPTSL